jgi:glucose uptake protein GlcU
MRQQVAATVNPISYPKLKPDRQYLRSKEFRLFNVILFSVFGGMYLTEGFHDLRSKSEYHLAFDFVMVAAFLIIATVNGIRLLRADKK